MQGRSAVVLGWCLTLHSNSGPEGPRRSPWCLRCWVSSLVLFVLITHLEKKQCVDILLVVLEIITQSAVAENILHKLELENYKILHFFFLDNDTN